MYKDSSVKVRLTILSNKISIYALQGLPIFEKLDIHDS